MAIKFDSMSESDQAYSLHKASTLVEALPYIRQHSGKIIVIKYGGHAMGNKRLSQSFAKDVGLLKEVGIQPVVVHGGGPQIANMLKEKNIKSEFVEGLRITNKEVVKIVEKVLSDDINGKIVKDIIISGGKAIGLKGSENNLIEAEKLQIFSKNSDSNIEKILDIGFVGNPIKINTTLIKEYLNNDYIPVISPLGTDNLNTYNINADTAAGFVAGALKSDKLLLLTDVAGVLNKENNLISKMNLNQAVKILNEDFISGGMKPKIETCIKALESGVKETTILDGHISHAIVLELFTDIGIGTMIQR